MNACRRIFWPAAPRAVRLAVAAALAASSVAAQALPIAWVGGAGDWFDATKWNPAQVPAKAPPVPTNEVFVNNGGVVSANSSSAFYPGGGAAAAANTLSVGAESSGPSTVLGSVQGTGVVIDTNGLIVGSASGTVTDATGVVQVMGAGVNAPSQLAIGTLSGLPSGFASGMVTVSGGDVRGTPVVGQTVLAGGDAEATGRLSISNGDLLLSPGGFGPLVGVNFQSDGTADGRIDIVNGSISLNDPLVTSANLQIGVANGGIATGAVSALTIDTSVNALQSLQIGVALNSGQADGTLSLAGGTLRVADGVVIGKSFAQAGGHAIGVANLAATQIEGPGLAGASFEVGSVNAGQLVNNVGFGTTDGQAAVAGSSAYQIYRVGSIIGTVVNNSVRADGVLNVGTGGLSAAPTSAGTLQIGVSQGTPNNNQLVGPGGSANGAVTVTSGDVSNFISIQVGRAVGFGTGKGSLEIADSNMVMGGGNNSAASFQVGTASNINGAITGVVAPVGEGEVIIRNSALLFQPGNPFPSLLSVGEAIMAAPLRTHQSFRCTQTAS